MKILTSIAVAGLAAAVVISVGATGASAGGWDGDGWHKHKGPYPYHQSHEFYRDRGDTGGALVAGAFLGLALGALATDAMVEPEPVMIEPEPPPFLPPPHPNYSFAEDQHVAWCAQTYRSYNAERDTFFDFRGVERRCITPYE